MASDLHCTEWPLPDIARKPDKFFLDVVPFHDNWSLLMPVVQRIGVISFEDGYFNKERHYYPVTFGMIDEESGLYMFRFKKFGLFKAETLIEATWLAVVDFVKFYNQNSK